MQFIQFFIPIKRLLSLGGFIIFISPTLHAQTPKPKGTFYAAWGYNKDYFSNSTIHFKNAGSDNYDFTLENLKAKDRPQFNEILKTDITIPQYVYRIGYFFNDKNDLGIELNFDHAKYVMEDSQTVHLTGRIHGVDYNKDTLVTPSFLKFEHTNGANFLMANLIKRVRYKYYPVVGIVKLGAGVVIPKTDVTLFGERLDNVFHVAGYIVGAEAGLRYKFYKHFFIEASAKGAYANYTNVLTVGTGKANHHFFVGEYILNGGVSFPL